MHSNHIEDNGDLQSYSIILDVLKLSRETETNI